MTHARATAPVRARTRVAGLIAGLAVGLLLWSSVSAPAPAWAELEPPAVPLVQGPVAGWPQPEGIGADAWLLVDAASGQVLAEHDADRRRPVASTVKVLTALSVLERSDPDEQVTVGDEVEVGGASVGLDPGDQWTVEQLLEGLVVRSGNDAAEALAVHVAGGMGRFVELMAADAAALGLEGAVITEASGLADGNELSARDLAVIARVGLAHPELRPLLAREVADLPGRDPEPNRNELLGTYPGATGLKTGYTARAGFGLIASAERDGRELIAVVLGADEDPARFDDAAGLLDHGFDAYEPRTLGLTWELLVGGGVRTLVASPETLVAPREAEVSRPSLPPARPARGTLPAPVAVEGRAVATSEIEIGDGPTPVAGSSALGRALVDEVYAGMRAATAAQRW